MSVREAHIFTFTGQKIADAARELAREETILIRILESRLLDQMTLARIALEASFEKTVDDRLMHYFPDEYPSAGITVGSSWGPTEQASPTVSFSIETKDFAPIVITASQLRDSNKKLDEYERAAARYGSQPKVQFELDEKDVNYFALDRPS